MKAACTRRELKIPWSSSIESDDNGNGDGIRATEQNVTNSGNQSLTPALSETADLVEIINSDNSSILDRENALSRIEQLSLRQASLLSSTLDCAALLRVFVASSSENARRNVINVIKNITSVCVPPSLISMLSQLVDIACQIEDPELRESIEIVIMNTCSDCGNSMDVDTLCVGYLCGCLQDPKKTGRIRAKACQTLRQLVQNEYTAAVLYNQHIDFSQVFSCVQNHSEYESVMDLLQCLLPACRMLEPLGHTKKQKFTGESAFACEVQPALIDSLISRTIGIPRTLVTFAATLSVNVIPLPDQLIANLLEWSSQSRYAPFVMAVVSQFAKENRVLSTRFWNVLRQTIVPESISNWYQQGLAYLERYSVELHQWNFELMSFEEFHAAITGKTLHWMDFVSGGGASRLKQLLETQDPSVAGYGDVVQYLQEVVRICPLANNVGSESLDEFVRFLRSHELINLVDPNTKQLILVKAPVLSSISTVEGLVNGASYDEHALEQTLKDYKQMFPSDPNEHVPASHLSVLFRGLDSKYQNIVLKGQSGTYTVADSLLSLVCDSKEDRDSLPTFECCKVEGPQRVSKPRLRRFTSHWDSVFECLRIVNQRTHSNVENQELEARVCDTLKYPLNSIGRMSPNFSLIFQYPELFSLQLRLLAFKLITLDPLSALQVLSNHLYKQETPGKIPLPNPLPIRVSRERVGDQGRWIVSHFSANRVPFGATFEGEIGKGPGVTREFMSLVSEHYAMSEELKDIWRQDKTNGLFPSPVADPQVFEEIGRFVAKAVTMQCPIDLPFNPAFISLARGQSINIEDVDPVFARSLESDLTGLRWIYPGFESLVLPGQADEVNQANQQEYVALIKTITLDEARKCAEAFRAGFESVLCFDLCDIFTDQELLTVMNGSSRVTLEDLEQEIELCGFESDEPLIRSLFQMLVNNDVDNDEFWRFVTGSKRLPCGGLKLISPRVCINRVMSDERRLPVAHTCCNTLDLPRYVGDSVLKSNLLLALVDGQGSFHLG